MKLHSVLVGCGSFLPERILTNDELSKSVDTDDAWIRERTGIAERRIANDDQLTSDLAVMAGEQALGNAGLTPSDIDLVIVATTTPDNTFPATAAYVQAKMGIPACTAFDVQAVCSGFVYGLATADNFLKAGQNHRALVIGAETFSRIIDWKDRGTCVLFGDGAGAFILEARPYEPDSGVIATELMCDGNFAQLLYVDGGVSSTQTAGIVKMQGNKVFRQAVGRISQAIEAVANRANIAASDIDWFVPHQANQRIIYGVIDHLGLPKNKVISTIALHGNTSAASIPLAFSTAVEGGRIKAGDLIMMEAMGGGLTWGAALLRA